MVNGAAPTKAILTKAIGTSGLSIWRGRLNEEYLSLLNNWQQAAKIYIEMGDDVTVGALLDAIKFPLMAAEFDVIPAGDTEEDAAAAEFLWDNMNGMAQQTWRSHVYDTLDALQFGFSAGEMVFDKRDDGRIHILNIDPRGQETLDHWEWEDDRAVGMTQMHPTTGELLTIPMFKLVHVALFGRKGNPQGKSLLRSVYRPWRMAKDFENLEGIGVERDVGGTPTVKFTSPELFEGWDTAQLTTMFADVLDSLRMDSAAGVINVPGSEIIPYGSTSKAYNVRDIIKDKQKEILMRFFAQFLTLGMDNVGTQALVKGSQDFFTLVLTGVQAQLVEMWQNQFVKLLFEINLFPGITDVPKLVWMDPGKIDLTALMDFFTKGINSRTLTPTRIDEEHLRTAADLPELPEDLGNEPREAPSLQPAFPGFGGV